MATKIVTKNSSTAGAAPTATDLVQGELAVNVADGRLYTEDNAAAIVELGVNPATEITANAGIALPDSQKATFGASDDLQIYHSGTGSYITDSGTGALYIQGQNLLLQNNDGSKVYFSGIGDVSTLYYGTGTKLATTSTGIDVTGTASATSVTSAQHLTAGSAYSLLFGDGGERISGNNSSSLLNFFTGATERMRIDSSGRVGIGMVPQTVLDLQATDNLALRFYNSTSFKAGIQVPTTAGDMIAGSAVNDLAIRSQTNMLFATGGNTERMRITSDGEIRTSNAVIVGRLADRQSQAVGVTDATLVLAGNSNVSGAGEEIGKVAFYTQDASGAGHNLAATVKALTNSAIGANADLVFSTKQGAGEGAEALESMRIDSSGNVGIGTSSPTAKATIEDGDFARLDLNLSNATGTTIADVRGLVEGTEKWRIGKTGSSSDDFAINVAGTEGMRIDSSGKVLLNTANSPTTTKAIISSDYSATGTTNTGLTITGRQGGNWWNNGIHALGASGLVLSTGTTGTNGADATNERMRIDSSGNVGIGTSSPAVPLHVNGGTDNQIGLIESTDATVKLGFKDNSTTNNYSVTIGAVGNAMTFTSGGGGSERMRIDASGNLLVGTTSTSVTSGGFAFFTGSTDFQLIGHASGVGAGNYYIGFAYNGSTIGAIVQNGTTGVAYNTSSDQRLKENIADADDAGGKIDAIQVRQYDWKADGSHQDYGVVAQELVEIAPEAVTVPADSEEMMGVDYSKLVPMLIKEIQSLRNRVAQLETGE